MCNTLCLQSGVDDHQQAKCRCIIKCRCKCLSAWVNVILFGSDTWSTWSKQREIYKCFNEDYSASAGVTRTQQVRGGWRRMEGEESALNSAEEKHLKRFAPPLQKDTSDIQTGCSVSLQLHYSAPEPQNDSWVSRTCRSDSGTRASQHKESWLIQTFWQTSLVM